MAARPLIPLLPAALALTALLTACAKPAAYTDGARIPARIGGQDFQLELSLTMDSRKKGLGGRPALAANEGMLFAYPFPRSGMDFVMRDCPHAMDIVFLDALGRMLRGFTMQPEPPGTPVERLHRYECPEAAQFVVELPPGSIEALRLAPGSTRIALPWEALAKSAK